MPPQRGAAPHHQARLVCVCVFWQFYDEQVNEDKVEARFPLLNEEELVMTQNTKKHKSMLLKGKVGTGSYDSTMTAFDLEREAAILAVP